MSCDSSKRLMVSARENGEMAQELFQRAVTMEKSEKYLELLEEAIAKIEESAQLRRQAIAIQFEEIRREKNDSQPKLS